MRAIQRMKAAVLSALQGWLCAWLILGTSWTLRLLLARIHPPFANLFETLLIWMAATGFVTLVTTILLVIPYVCLRDVDIFLSRPWRVFIEVGTIAIIAALIVGHLTKPYAVSYWGYTEPILMIALLISLASSAFYLRKSKAALSALVVEA